MLKQVIVRDLLDPSRQAVYVAAVRAALDVDPAHPRHRVREDEDSAGPRVIAGSAGDRKG
jgi:hypothetical protein